MPAAAAQPVTPTVPGTEHRASPRALVAATLTLVLAFAVSSSPVPLFTTYRRADGLTDGDFSLATVAYFAGTILALLVLGRLSTHLGRRPLALAAAALLLAGALVMLRVDSLAPLALGRFLSGLGCGIASSAVMSYVVDAAPRRPAWLATMITSQAPMVGLTLGALGSGLIVEHGPRPTTTVFLVGAGAMTLCLIALAIAPETGPRLRGALASLRPRVAVPAAARQLLPALAAVVVSTWAMGSFYQAFGPSVVADGLGTDDAVVFAVVFSAYMLPSVLGAPIGGRMRAATAQRTGMTVFAIGVLGVLTALALDSVVLFIAASVVAGAGQGMAMSASVRSVLSTATPAETAPTMAAVYLLSYSGAMAASLISGQLTRWYGVEQIVIGYGVLAVAAAVVTALCAREPRPVEAPAA